jgi:hypothetical protein
MFVLLGDNPSDYETSQTYLCLCKTKEHAELLKEIGPWKYEEYEIIEENPEEPQVVVAKAKINAALAKLTEEEKRLLNLDVIHWLCKHAFGERTPDQWCKLLNTEIMDPDGWDRTDGSYDLPLGLIEFVRRYINSTTRM